MSRSILVMVVALIACTGTAVRETADSDEVDWWETDACFGTDTGDTGELDTGDTGGITGPDRIEDVAGDCPQAEDIGEAVEGAFLVGEVSSSYEEYWYESRVDIADTQAEYDHLLTLVEFRSASTEPDLRTHRVVHLSTFIGASCGVNWESWRVGMFDGVAVVETVTHDPWGTCEEQCDMEHHVGWLIAVPRELDVRPCARLRFTCET